MVAATERLFVATGTDGDRRRCDGFARLAVNVIGLDTGSGVTEVWLLDGVMSALAKLWCTCTEPKIAEGVRWLPSATPRNRGAAGFAFAATETHQQMSELTEFSVLMLLAVVKDVI